MLNNDALQQLSQLKTSIRASKPIAEGTVRTTTKRFGFIKLDDGRDAFVDPEQMMRLLPDDRVQIELVTNAKNQLEARLEKLLGSSLKQFVGSCRFKGSACFVEPDWPQFNRWLFIPPQDRKNCEEGDLLLCELVRHPFNNQGKAQVKVLARLGRPDEPGIEAKYLIAKYQLIEDWPEEAIQQAKSISDASLDSQSGHEDLTHLPFVTIDSESTRDMDDALHVRKTDTGWELTTAIADPSRHIAWDSPLERAARQRASSVYLLGHTLTMLPAELAHNTYSLVADEDRPVLACRMQINAEGQIESYQFVQGVIRSRAKLSYEQVQQYLSGDASALANLAPELVPQIGELLQQLQSCAQTRSQHRLDTALVMEDRADYYYQLNEQRKIERIERRQRNQAQRLVEEAMLATNICAGDFFRQHPGYGIFTTHIGFRPERIEDALSLIREDKPDWSPGDLAQLEHFQQLLRSLRLDLDQDPKNAPLQSVLQRMLQAGALSFEPEAHFGLGFESYATITSPIRRYQDLYNHLALKRKLAGQPPLKAPGQLLEQLQDTLNRGRNACRQLELWLCCQYLTDHIGSLHPGIITQVNAQGLGVRLDDIGVEGFVQLADKEAGIKPAFDARRYSLTHEGWVYRLDEAVNVQVDAVDIDRRRISLSLVDAATAERMRVWQQMDKVE